MLWIVSNTLHCSMYTACVLFIYSCAPRTDSDDEIYDAVGLKVEPMPDRLAALRATTTETSSLNATMSQLEGQINIHSLPFDIILKISYFLTILDVVRWSQCSKQFLAWLNEPSIWQHYARLTICSGIPLPYKGFKAERELNIEELKEVVIKAYRINRAWSADHHSSSLEMGSGNMIHTKARMVRPITSDLAILVRRLTDENELMEMGILDLADHLAYSPVMDIGRPQHIEFAGYLDISEKAYFAIIVTDRTGHAIHTFSGHEEVIVCKISFQTDRPPFSFERQELMAFSLHPDPGDAYRLFLLDGHQRSFCLTHLWRPFDQTSLCLSFVPDWSQKLIVKINTGIVITRLDTVWHDKVHVCYWDSRSDSLIIQVLQAYRESDLFEFYFYTRVDLLSLASDGSNTEFALARPSGSLPSIKFRHRVYDPELSFSDSEASRYLKYLDTKLPITSHLIGALQDRETITYNPIQPPSSDATELVIEPASVLPQNETPTIWRVGHSAFVFTKYVRNGPDEEDTTVTLKTARFVDQRLGAGNYREIVLPSNFRSDEIADIWLDDVHGRIFLYLKRNEVGRERAYRNMMILLTINEPQYREPVVVPEGYYHKRHELHMISL